MLAEQVSPEVVALLQELRDYGSTWRCPSQPPALEQLAQLGYTVCQDGIIKSYVLQNGTHVVKIGHNATEEVQAYDELCTYRPEFAAAHAAPTELLDDDISVQAKCIPVNEDEYYGLYDAQELAWIFENLTDVHYANVGWLDGVLVVFDLTVKEVLG